MKRQKDTLGIAILLFAATVNTIHAKDKLPGLAAQPASYFYTGKPYDQDLGAYVFAYRYYDPSVSRWTTSDPSGFPNGANNSSYAFNSPTVAVDPDGLEIKVKKAQAADADAAWIYQQYKGSGLEAAAPQGDGK